MRLLVSLIMLPHSGIGGFAPSPRKLSAASPDVQHGCDQNGADDVGQDVLEDDLSRAAAGQPDGLHPLGFFLRQCLASGDPGVFRPRDRRQCDNGVLQSAPQHPRHRKCEHQTGERQKHVGNAHQHRIGQAADPAAGHAHRRAKGRDDGNQQKRGKNTRPASGNDPGQHIPAVPVCSQRMGFGRRLLGDVQILEVRVIGRQVLRKEGANNQGDCQDGKKNQADFHRVSPDCAYGGFYGLHPACTPSRILGSRTW